MCEPTTIMMGLSLATAAGTAIQTVNQQNKMADAQEKALTDASAQSATQAQIEQAQINEQATDELSLRARTALSERARLRVAAAESGVGGQTTQRVVNNPYTQAGWDMSRIRSNTQKAKQQSSLNAQGRAAGYASQASSIQRGSMAGAGLQIAGAGADMYLRKKGY